MLLILGHGKLYHHPHGRNQSSIRCSPIPVENWINQEYISVDNRPEVEPDIIYDLNQDTWYFAEDNQFEQIIDTTGLGLSHKYKKQSFIDELNRILKPNGIFHGWRNFKYQKPEE